MQICDVHIHEAAEFFTESGFDPDAMAVYLHELKQLKGLDNEQLDIHVINVAHLAVQGAARHRKRKTRKYLESLL